MKLRLAAFDLDGTLLDPYGKLTPSVCEAIRELRRRMRVVLCTGRRFRTALVPARELGFEEGAIVVNNGVVVKDLATGHTLQHQYLPAQLYPEVIEHVRAHGSPLVYLDAYHEGTDIVTETPDRAHPFQREYLDDNGEFSRVLEDVTARGGEGVIMVSTMADELSLDTLRRGATERFGERIYTHAILNKNYQGSILEFLSPQAGKWSALAALARDWGIAPEEIAAVGDDANDAELIRRAGFGIAMGNGVAAAREAARLVVSSNAEGGAVEAVEKILLRA